MAPCDRCRVAALARSARRRLRRRAIGPFWSAGRAGAERTQAKPRDRIHTMKTTLIVLGALLFATSAQAQSRRNPETGPAVAESNSTMLVKMTSDVSSVTSKPGDVISGV